MLQLQRRIAGANGAWRSTCSCWSLHVPTGFGAALPFLPLRMALRFRIFSRMPWQSLRVRCVARVARPSGWRPSAVPDGQSCD